MTETTVKNELEALAPGQLSLVEGSFTVQDLADKLTAPVPAPADEDNLPIPFPALPKHVELTPDARAALNKVPKVFGSVEMETRRRLTDAELKLIAEEDDAVSRSIKTLQDRQKAIRETIRHHNDVVALEGGEAVDRRRRVGSRIVEATTRDHSGHLLLAKPGEPREIKAPGFAKGWRQSFTSGSTEQSLALLEQLFKAEQITRAEYLACTREVRVLDEDRIKDFIRKNADRGLRILKAITIRKPPNSSLNGPSRD